MANPFDLLAVKFEAPGRVIREFQTLHKASPDLAKSLLKELADVCGVSIKSNGVRGRGSGGNYEKVAAYLAAHGNKPLSRQDLAKATGVKTTSLHSIVYKAHKADFEAVPLPEGGKGKAYRLTQAALDEAKQEATA